MYHPEGLSVMRSSFHTALIRAETAEPARVRDVPHPTGTHRAAQSRTAPRGIKPPGGLFAKASAGYSDAVVVIFCTAASSGNENVRRMIPRMATRSEVK